MAKEEFTINHAIAVQTRQLKDYEYALKPEIYARLKALITEENCKAVLPCHIVRGVEIDNILWNEIINKR